VQAGVVGNIDGARTTMDGVVSASQSATGALQAAQAGNQLLALQSQQLADLTALLAAQGRAQALDRRATRPLKPRAANVCAAS
jgi:P-type conjugative transfer protein TrbJ